MASTWAEGGDVFTDLILAWRRSRWTGQQADAYEALKLLSRGLPTA